METQLFRFQFYSRRSQKNDLKWYNAARLLKASIWPTRNTNTRQKRNTFAQTRIVRRGVEVQKIGMRHSHATLFRKHDSTEKKRDKIATWMIVECFRYW